MAHYVAKVDDILEPLNSSAGMMQAFLRPDEATAARRATLGRDSSTIKRLGVIARDRAASLSGADVANLLPANVRQHLKLAIKDDGRATVVINGRETSWANAILQGMVSIGS